MEDEYSGSNMNTRIKKVVFYPGIRSHEIVLCKLVILLPYKNVRVKAVTKISGFIHTKIKPSLWAERRIRSVNEIYEVVAKTPFDILWTNYSAVERKLAREMVIRYASRNAVISLAIRSTMANRICESLNLMVDKSTAGNHTAATNRSRWPVLCSFEWRDFTFNIHKSGVTLIAARQDLRRTCFEAAGFSSRQSREQTPPLHDWQLMVDLFLVEGKAHRKEIIEMLSKHKDLWGGHLRTIKATHHTLDWKERTCLFRKQPYLAGEDLEKRLMNTLASSWRLL